jgi:ADP-ribose pyrophosphatase YjhB (NUDIX family)
MRVPIEMASVIPTAASLGFRFHHAQGSEAMLLNWLPGGSNPVPDFATHVVGVGGLALNDRREVLVVKERVNPSAKLQGSWKLPGGLMDLGEEIGVAVAREVREETGVDAAFRSVLAVRHQHGAAFGRDDLYAVCLLEPRSESIAFDAAEISEARWLPLAEYAAATRETSARFGVAENMNAFIIRNVLDVLAASGADADATELIARLGLSASELPSTALGQGVTGLNSRPSYFLYHPPSFTNLDLSESAVSERGDTIGPPEMA